ncbi:MAG: hypothetical protein ACR2MN_15865 [Acidimicrobiales bacterium]
MTTGPAVRVVTDVAALDKEFDYLVPDDLVGRVGVGTMVRVALGGRRVGAWVVATDVEPDPARTLRPVSHRRGWGPEPALVDLAAWAAWRWAGRRSALLRTASPLWAVRDLPAPALTPPPPPRLTTTAAQAVAGMVADALAPSERGPAGPALMRLPPNVDPVGVVATVAQNGPTLVVAPSIAAATVLAGRLRRAGSGPGPGAGSGSGIALVPEQWAQARAGAAVVVGARAAAWAPCPGLASVVVIDGHDEGLHQEQNPTWDATTVAAERARRAGAACIVTSACPTLDLLAVASKVVVPSRRLERDGWAPLEVVDRRADDPRLGLYSEALVRMVRDGGRVACVLNRKGRARLLACRACGTVARCDRCGSAMAEDRGQGEGEGGDVDGGAQRRLVCPQCRWTRPWLCTACGSITLRQLRVGVSRAREELASLAGRAVVEVTAATPAPPDGDGEADVMVGTEAVLHRGWRGGRLDAVAFLDFDGELLAPRFRAGEEALGLLARASRIVGGRAGRVLVQTRVPDHVVIAAALAADPDRAAAGEREVRAALGWPPFAALAAIGGEGAPEMVDALAGLPGIDVLGPEGGRWLIRAGDPAVLADALAGVGRPAARVRVEVDPLRV